MRMKYFAVTVFLCFGLLTSFSDAKGFKGGRIKVKVPKIPLAPKVSLPKGPRFPVIVPLPIFLPVGNFRRLNSNERVNCYACEGDDKSLCALNPAGNVQRMKCQNSYYCSTVRKEVNDDGTSIKASQYNVTDSSRSSNETTVAVLDGTQKLNKTLVAEAANASATNVTEGSPTESSTTASVTNVTEGSLTESSTTASATTSVEEESSNSTVRIKREDKVRVVISRGCKRLDFIDGFALAQRSGSDGNVTERAYAQLCSSDLCNSGDGRLRCYECSGSGVDHPCMKTPTTVAKAVTCEWNEVCYVDRYMQADSINATNNVIQVKRGCRRSSLTVDEEGKILSSDNKVSLSCRLSSYCNSFDANRLVRNSATAGYQIAPYSIVLGLFTSFLLGSRAF